MSAILPRRPLSETVEVPGHDGRSTPTQFLRELLSSSLILAEDWETLPTNTQDELLNCQAPEHVLPLLVQHNLLTEYQAARIEAGKTFGLVLGNYRVLNRIGAGGMGVVFKGEHLRMRRLVAIKVLPLSGDRDARLLRRFIREMRAVAQLRHPNIVSALDDGEVPGCGADEPSLHYFVMEYVPGQDLEEFIPANGALDPSHACGLAYQVASALREAHGQGLVHRDIKPSNIHVTPDGDAKLLDFGLVLHSENRMTEPGTVLGTFDYLAPEQAQDASAVDVRAERLRFGRNALLVSDWSHPVPVGWSPLAKPGSANDPRAALAAHLEAGGSRRTERRCSAA